MLSSVLHSDRAVHVNIEIMRAFVRLRQMLARMPISRASLRRWKRNTTPNSGGIRRHPRTHDPPSQEETPIGFAPWETSKPGKELKSETPSDILLVIVDSTFLAHSAQYGEDCVWFGVSVVKSKF